MRKKMFAALGIILMLFAFVACQGEPTTITEEQAKANELAADYISSIRYAEVLNVAFKNNPELKVENTTADSVTVTFNNYTGDAVPATGDIKGIKKGSLKYTFTTTTAPTTKAATKGYTIETVDPLVFSLKDGSTAEDTIEFKISGSCTIELTTDSSNKITGVKSAEFGEVKTAEGIIVGDMPVNIEDIEIDIDNSTPSTEPSEPTEKIYTLEKDTKVSEIENLASYDGIEGNGKTSESYVLTVDETINLTNDFTFKNIILKGTRDENSAKASDNPIGINLSDSTTEITINIINADVSSFGTAIMSNKVTGSDGSKTFKDKSMLTLNIEGSTFHDCYKGLYATNLKDLKVTGSTFTNMGADSVAAPDDPNTSDLIKRSGSALDINQMLSGDSIVIENSTFSQCGAAEDTQEKTTSGAIKVKVRGGDNETGTDIPENANGSFAAGLTVEKCTFNSNRKDIVLGTDKSVDSADFNFTYTAGTENPKIEDNAENTLVIVKATDYSDIDDEISEYAGIRGTSDKPVISIDKNNPIKPSNDFIFRSITLDGGQTGQDPAEQPIGIDVSSHTDGNISITIVDSKLQNFGYAINSNKANGRGSSGSVKEGTLTLTITDSDFLNCFKGLYATDIKNLTVTGGTYEDMGTASKNEANNVVKRSGAAFDINQMASGDDNQIVFDGVTFKNCGGEKKTSENEEVTSGAIKVKVRGSGDDKATDIPKITTPGAIKSLTVKDCTFDGNRADVVLGTSGYASTGNFTVNNDIQTANNPKNNIKVEKRFESSYADNQ